MKQKNKEFMELMDGEELWTNAFEDRFGERVCVGFVGIQCVVNGEYFVPTDKEVNELMNDQLIEEYGTTDMKTIMKMEGF